MRQLFVLILIIVLSTAAISCNDSEIQDVQNQFPPLEYAIAIHGGAGVMSRDMPAETREAYIRSLTEALTIGRDLLAEGASSLDAIESVIRFMEDDPLFNAGHGAVLTNTGTAELDASVMDGRDLSAGAIAGVKTVKNPISLARHVMENSRHVLFAGEGAEHYADQAGVERVENSYFITDNRRRQLERAIERDEVSLDHSGGSATGYFPESANDRFGTVGVVALDRDGNLAAGTSTGGMTNKRFGRVGDSPIIGAGTYADNRTCAISSTGTGEEFIRNAVAYQISAIMEFTGASLHEAASIVVHEKLKEGDGGIIGVGSDGSIAMVFNTPGMYRGAANSEGLFDVKIWD
ncbi:MAG: isoaspartyl peptidase/L-asparaginase [Rhodothermaceae bacterium]|nr:isoaspartyl peptidase/L-asparaginase [Rhodothermaceae bacterium]